MLNKIFSYYLCLNAFFFLIQAAFVPIDCSDGGKRLNRIRIPGSNVCMCDYHEPNTMPLSTYKCPSECPKNTINVGNYACVEVETASKWPSKLTAQDALKAAFVAKTLNNDGLYTVSQCKYFEYVFNNECQKCEKAEDVPGSPCGCTGFLKSTLPDCFNANLDMQRNCIIKAYEDHLKNKKLVNWNWENFNNCVKDYTFKNYNAINNVNCATNQVQSRNRCNCDYHDLKRTLVSTDGVAVTPAVTCPSKCPDGYADTKSQCVYCGSLGVSNELKKSLFYNSIQGCNCFDGGVWNPDSASCYCTNGRIYNPKNSISCTAACPTGWLDVKTRCVNCGSLGIKDNQCNCGFGATWDPFFKMCECANGNLYNSEDCSGHLPIIDLLPFPTILTKNTKYGIVEMPQDYTIEFTLSPVDENLSDNQFLNIFQFTVTDEEASRAGLWLAAKSKLHVGYSLNVFDIDFDATKKSINIKLVAVGNNVEVYLDNQLVAAKKEIRKNPESLNATLYISNPFQEAAKSPITGFRMFYGNTTRNKAVITPDKAVIYSKIEIEYLPSSLAIDKDDNIYYSTFGTVVWSQMLQKFNPYTGDINSICPGEGIVYSRIAISGNNIYFCGMDNKLFKCTSEKDITDLNIDGLNSGQISIDSKGDLYVATFERGGITKVTVTGGNSWAELVERNNPEDNISPTNVAIDSHDNIYFADQFRHVIQKIDKNGNTVNIAGSPGQPGVLNGKGAEARFNSPGAITFDAYDNIYVNDLKNKAIRKISPDGMVYTLSTTGFWTSNNDGNFFSLPNLGQNFVSSIGTIYAGGNDIIHIFKQPSFVPLSKTPSVNPNQFRLITSDTPPKCAYNDHETSKVRWSSDKCTHSSSLFTIDNYKVTTKHDDGLTDMYWVWSKSGLAIADASVPYDGVHYDITSQTIAFNHRECPILSYALAFMTGIWKCNAVIYCIGTGQTLASMGEQVKLQKVADVNKCVPYKIVDSSWKPN